jgi:NAD(P)-dependent dehydrogenase (short-subunit alcohol dehydrogenase family)
VGARDDVSAVRRALVTGGGRGIGAAIAVALADAGHRVAVTARSEAQLAQVAERSGGVALAADLADAGAAERVADRAEEALGGPVDVFVHAAGIAENGPLESIRLEAWERSFAVNVTAAFVIGRRIGPAMKERGWGRILTVCSVYSRMGVARAAAYTASKHALLGLTRAMAAELVAGGVTANAIVPGFTDTEMVREQAAEIGSARGVEPEEIARRFLRAQPLGRMLDVEEVAALAAYLCGDAAAGITGQAINIDGGAYQA